MTAFGPCTVISSPNGRLLAIAPEYWPQFYFWDCASSRRDLDQFRRHLAHIEDMARRHLAEYEADQ
jgi:hypothetical protein